MEATSLLRTETLVETILRHIDPTGEGSVHVATEQVMDKATKSVRLSVPTDAYEAWLCHWYDLYVAVDDIQSDLCTGQVPLAQVIQLLTTDATVIIALIKTIGVERVLGLVAEAERSYQLANAA
jgi:hypothetical protein